MLEIESKSAVACAQEIEARLKQRSALRASCSLHTFTWISKSGGHGHTQMCWPVGASSTADSHMRDAAIQRELSARAGLVDVLEQMRRVVEHSIGAGPR